MLRNSALFALSLLLSACASGGENRVEEAVPATPPVEGQPAQDSVRKSLELFDSGRAADSLAMLQQGVEASPEDRSLRLALAVRQISLSKNDEAEALLNKLIEEDPRDPAPRLPLARLLRAQRRTYEAEGQYESLIQLDPGALDIRAELGRMLESEQADPALIYAHYHHVSANASSEAPGWGLAAAWLTDREARWGVQKGFNAFEQGVTAYLSGKPEESVARLAEAADTMPSNATASYYMGLAHLRSDQYKEAERDFSRATRLAPEDGRAWYQLGWVYKITNHPAKARQAWTEAARRLPGDRRIVPLIASLDEG